MFDAEDWYKALNAHDLERILAHYDDAIRFYSPFAAALVPGSEGLIEGKEALRKYFETALAKYPDLRFEPWDRFDGAGSAVLRYRSVAGKTAAEVFVLGPDGKIVEVRAHYHDRG